MRYLIRDEEIEGGKDIDRCHFLLFSSPIEHFGYIMKARASGVVGSLQRVSGDRLPEARARFLGRSDIHDWESLWDALISSYRPGVQEIEEMIEELQHQTLRVPKSIRRRPVYGTEEGEFCLDRYVGGAEDYWRAPCRRETNGKQNVVLVVNTIADKNQTSHTVRWRGAAAATVAAILEAQGYSVEIIGMSMLFRNQKDTRANKKRCFNTVTASVMLKASEHPIDLGQIEAGLSLWYQRTLRFALDHTIPNCHVSPIHGFVREIENRDVEHCYPGANAIVINDCDSRELATSKILEIVKFFTGAN